MIDDSHTEGRRSVSVEADRVLYQRLIASNFEGPQFDILVDRLIRYAHPILRSWIASGEIIARLRAIRSPALPPLNELQQITSQDVEDLTWGVLADAAVSFKRAGLAGQGWSATGGSSLATYFVGGCLLAFGNVFRRWHRDERRWRDLVDPAAPIPDRETADPADLVSDTQAAHSILAFTDERTRLTIGLLSCGYSHAEIAEELGTSTRAVEGQIYRFRQTFKRQRRSTVGSRALID